MISNYFPHCLLTSSAVTESFGHPLAILASSFLLREYIRREDAIEGVSMTQKMSPSLIQQVSSSFGQDDFLTNDGGTGTANTEKLDDYRKRVSRINPPWKQDLTEKKKSGPVSPRNVKTSSSAVAHSQIPLSVASALRRRHTNPGAESPFKQQVVNQPAPTGIPRKRISPSNSFRQQVGAVQSSHPSRRSQTTNDDSDLTKKRIERVQRARLYLLQQTGPNSFLIGGDSPDHKFRVIIGPQTCSCGRFPFCVHILFVMLRVFQVSELDPRLWNKTLKNYEVESLFRIYHDKRSSRIHSRKQEKSVKAKPIVEENHVSDSSENTSLPSESETGSTREEDDTCPICLLEMLEGESLIKCENGCQNRLHHHCIAIWFEECRRQNDPLNCPLCRTRWKSTTVEIKSCQNDNEDTPEVPPNTRAPSPQGIQVAEGRLPHAESIPQENQAVAEPWIEVLGEDLVCCLFSRNWSIREMGVKHLSKEVVGTLLRGMGEGRSGVIVSPTRQAATRQMLDTCSTVLAFMCADPVYRVFVASLRALRQMLAYTPCRDKQQQNRLQTRIKPIVDAIILKCTDGNKRTSQLSLSTLVELAKGQDGELAVGKEIVNPGSAGLDGLYYVLKCVTEQYNVDQVQWQWLLGRLYVIDRFLEEFPSDFLPQEEEHSGAAAAENGVPDAAGAAAPCENGVDEDSHNYHRLLAVAHFSVKAVCNAHTRIARMARRVFLLSAKLGAHLEGIVKEMEDLLSTIDSASVISVKRKLARIVSDFHISEKIVQELQHGTGKSRRHVHRVSSPFDTPKDSPVSTPRCTSPVTVLSEDAPSDVCSSQGGKGIPCCPPNTPIHRKRKKNRRSIPRRISKEKNLSTPPTSPGKIEENGFQNDGEEEEENTVDDSMSVNIGSSLPFIPLNLDPEIQPERISEMLNNVSLCEPAAVEAGKTQEPEDHFLIVDQENPGSPDGESCSPATASHSPATACCCLDKSQCDDTSIHSGTAAAPNTPEHAQCFHTADQETMSSDDLLDLNSVTSPLQACEQAVSFRSEVTQSPKISPSHTADQAAMREPEECHCKEEVEIEEAVAMAKAMEMSYVQAPCPVVPGLTPTSKEEVITIHIQPEDDYLNGPTVDHPSIYYEGIHWQKGPLLGTGAYSTCYQARDVATGVLMAVKQISFCRNSPSEQESVIDAIKEEVQMMSRLNHPNIVRIFGATKQGCHFNMFVEWMPGGSLTYLLGRYGAFSEYVITNYTRQILRGLAYLHDNQLLHRDLKGANLLVDGSGQHLRICDFGAAARLASQATGAGEFQGQLLGTIAFMAPEVLRGENYGRACDVWSVGCCMIEMKTTKPPWNAQYLSNHLALIFKIASSVEPPPIPDNLSPALKDLMLRCLEHESEFRPTAKELLMHPLFTQCQSR
ncbi:mitogen-activated protein kinase kinase kinase 1-like [Gigantopelta aegis]|uniref:mitogen-activated protein kinase kinase kinase 1-like n=1 Tax=Gigantopelta aegis TaxID=1735272 RepID=UPI001B88B31C|nr:mitogen-activated protein kinase kinase kinase 1-like [Gigantopelta aegis]